MRTALTVLPLKGWPDLHSDDSELNVPTPAREEVEQLVALDLPRQPPSVRDQPSRVDYPNAFGAFGITPNFISRREWSMK